LHDYCFPNYLIRGTTEGDNHRAILACTPNATPPPATLKTLRKNNHKQLVCLTSSIRRVLCRTQTTLFKIYSTRCEDKRRHCSNRRAAPDTGSAEMTTPRSATGVLMATDGAEQLLSSKVYERSTTDEFRVCSFICTLQFVNRESSKHTTRR